MLTLSRELPVKVPHGKVLWSSIGLGSSIFMKSRTDADAIVRTFSSIDDNRLFLYSLYNAILQLYIDDHKDTISRTETEFDYFLTN